jgi:sepiapterin reductase
VLVSRTEKDLQAAKSDIESSSPGTSVHVIPADLQDLSAIHDVFSRCAAVAAESRKKHEQFVIVHDAGSAGDITQPIVQQTDPSVLQQQLALNFTSMSVLTSLFLSRFASGERVVVNISSLLAKVHLAGFAMYSASRAARNALIGTFAAENPDVRFLTYTPGPCMTDMFKSIADSSHSQSTRDMFQAQIERNEVLTCQESISKLMELLRENRFENAAVIDYYDKV